MAKKTSARKKTSRAPARTAPTGRVPANGRTVLLAGLGAAALARRQALKAIDLLVVEGQALGGSLEARRLRIERSTRQRVDHLRGSVLPLAASALERAGRLRGELALRLQPLLARTGIELPAALRPVATKARRKPGAPAATSPGRKAGARAGRASARGRKVA